MRNRLGIWAPVLFAGLCGACGDGGDRSVVIPADVSLFAGVYDVEIDDPPAGVDGESVGVVSGSGRELGLTLHPPDAEPLTFYGTLGEDGSLTVNDAFGLVSDVAFFADLEATVRKVEDRFLITGKVDAPGAPSDLLRAFRFEMRRPVGTLSAGSAGSWTFTFPDSPSTCDCSSTAQLALDVKDSGGGSTLPVAELDAMERAVGFFHPGSLLLSPQGRIRISMRYGTPMAETCPFNFQGGHPRPCIVTLAGVLREGDGAGTFLVQEPSFFIPVGPLRPWSATRNGVTTAAGCSGC
jgi:hypothetical protein